MWMYANKSCIVNSGAGGDKHGSHIIFIEGRTGHSQCHLWRFLPQTPEVQCHRWEKHLNIHIICTMMRSKWKNIYQPAHPKQSTSISNTMPKKTCGIEFGPIAAWPCANALPALFMETRNHGTTWHPKAATVGVCFRHRLQQRIRASENMFEFWHVGNRSLANQGVGWKKRC